MDPNDSVGILDRYSLEIDFFKQYERFERHLEKLRHNPETERVHYVSICSPNYLHDSHCRLALGIGANVICEKPLVINPWNLDELQLAEAESGRRINTILQLRVHPSMIQLRQDLHSQRGTTQHDVCLTYVAGRGNWYHVSWKGSEEHSGGIATNIGIHLFDLLLWLFGSMEECRVYYADHSRMSGFLELEKARVKWFLSIDPSDLPFNPEAGERTTYRSITIDGQEIEFSEGFADLHTRVYEEILAGRGLGIEDVRPSTEVTHRIRTAPLSPWDDEVHPFLRRR
jgi:UDP-N-acetyl-2-amino-2-deoxyglucuronate dehydrogenase